MANSKHRIIIKDEGDFKRARWIIQNLKEYSKEKPYEFILRLFKRNRSAEQHGLYWTWMGYMEGNGCGYSKEWWHDYFKNKYVPRILIKTNEKLQKANEIIYKMRERGESEIPDLVRTILREVITTKKMSTDQFTEYLGYIKEEAWNDHKTLLPEPDGLKKGVDW